MRAEACIMIAIVSALIALAVLTGCTKPPPDVPACEHMSEKLFTDAAGHIILQPSPTCMAKIGEMECGHCVWIMTGKEQFVGEGVGHWLGGEPWSKVRAHSVYLPAALSYAPLSTYIINQCAAANCSSDVDKFKVKLDSLNGISDAILGPAN